MDTIRSVTYGHIISSFENDQLKDSRKIPIRFFMIDLRGSSYGRNRCYFLRRDGMIINLTMEEQVDITEYLLSNCAEEFLTDYERLYIDKTEHLPSGWTLSDDTKEHYIQGIAKKLGVSYPIDPKDFIFLDHETPERIGDYKDYPYTINDYYNLRN